MKFKLIFQRVFLQILNVVQIDAVFESRGEWFTWSIGIGVKLQSFVMLVIQSAKNFCTFLSVFSPIKFPIEHKRAKKLPVGLRFSTVISGRWSDFANFKELS